MLFFVEISVFLNYFQKRCNKTSFFGFYITEDSKFDIAYTSEAGETVVSKNVYWHCVGKLVIKLKRQFRRLLRYE
jgi:hypothetical protein